MRSRSAHYLRLFAMVAAATAAILSGSCSTAPRALRSPAAEQEEPDGPPGAPVSRRAAVKLLFDNSDAWNARQLAILKAQKSIDATYYILDDDVFGKTFLHLLLMKAKAFTLGNVKDWRIRLMVDASGSRKLDESLLQSLVDHGVQVKTYNPIVGNFGVGALYRNHDKILVQDEQVLITGGRNISRQYFLPHQDAPDSFIDACVMINSPDIAKDAVAAFEREWDGSWNHVVTKHAFGISKSDEETLLDASVAYSNIAMQLAVTPENLAKFPELKGITHFNGMSPWGPKWPHIGGRWAEVKLLDNTSAKHVVPLTQITDMYVWQIDHAGEEILLENPYVALPPKISVALDRAAKRGVKITLLTASPSSSDSKLVQAYFNGMWRELIEDYWPNFEIYAMPGPNKLHAKLAVFDGARAILGSYNLDYISERRNSEVAVFIDDERVAFDIRQQFIGYTQDVAVKYISEYVKERQPDGSYKLEVGPEQIPGSKSTNDESEKFYGLSELLQEFL